MFWVLFGAFVISGAFAIYVYFFNPTLLGSLGVGSVGSIAAYAIDTYSAFSVRLMDGYNVLAGGDGSVANVLLLVGMTLMVLVFVMNGLVTGLDQRRNNFTLVR